MEFRCRVRVTHIALSVVCLAVASHTFAQGPDTHVSMAEQQWEGVASNARAGVWLDQGPVSASDDRRDLVIGAPGGPGVLGNVYVINGGPQRTGALSLGNADAVITGSVAGDLFGTSTAVGNILSLEGTDPKNLVVGAPNAASGRGRVYLFVGGFSSAARLTASNAVFSVTGAPGDRLGTMLATADLDNDGYREIIIGAPGTQRIYVVQGGPSGNLNGARDLTVTPAAQTYTLPGVGAVIQAGDVTGDGIHDVLAGTPSQGGVFLFYGRNGSMPATWDAVFVGINVGDEAGSSIRLADMDADGNRDILIGAPGGDGPDEGRANAGEVYLIWGGTPLTSRVLDTADVTFYGWVDERLGTALTGGDINRDTPNDAVMLAAGASNGNGILYIYYGRSRSQLGLGGPGKRTVDFAANQFSRRIWSDTVPGAIVSTLVFEVTGEGARDIIVGIPTTDSNAGTVFFTLSPRMRLSENNITVLAERGSNGTAALEVRNSAPIPVTWTATSNREWLTVTPPSGSAVNTSPGAFTLNVVNTLALPPGTYPATVQIRSTSVDLFMTLTLNVTVVVTQTAVSIDGPANGATVTQPFNLVGWTVDLSATANSGIGFVHVYAFPASGASPIFMGAAASNASRPDVGAAFGAQFTQSGFSVPIRGLAPGTYRLGVFPYNMRWAAFTAVSSIVVNVRNSPVMNVDAPGPNATVSGTFRVAGWAIDKAAASGTGVDFIHIWAYPGNGGSPVFLGWGNYGRSRPDIAGVFGAQFRNSGYDLNVTGLAPGSYRIIVYAHSSVSGVFDNAFPVEVTVTSALTVADQRR
jgi:hypothetical protein